MSLKGKLSYVELTDTGQVRDHNEDAIASDVAVGLMVLADGMGGYNAGEVASGIAVSPCLTRAKSSRGAAQEHRKTSRRRLKAA